MDKDLNFMDVVLMGLDSIEAALSRLDDVMNPFNFSMWRSAPVELFSIQNTNSLENILSEMSTNLESQNSKELFSLKKTDTYSTISMVDSTGNAPTRTST
jgi:hypothetical protein